MLKGNDLAKRENFDITGCTKRYLLQEKSLYTFEIRCDNHAEKWGM